MPSQRVLKDEYRVIGLMSGTSMDGLDIVEVIFRLNQLRNWQFKLINATLFPYETDFVRELKGATSLSAEKMEEFSTQLGHFYAKKVNAFIEQFSIDKTSVDFIASHGQTIFHQPEKGFTLQIGNGPELAVGTQLPTITDFRIKDVALGGNGAPLIPVADFRLFHNYADTFLNLGGFSNFSYKKDEKVFSYDICPVNSIVNYLVNKVGLEYDKNGELGRQGTVNETLLKQLNALPYYQRIPPKSLGWEWVEQQILPLLTQENDLKNKIRTLYEHFSFQIGSSLNEVNAIKTLVTGGGAMNDFLIERIKNHTKSQINVPEKAIIDFKEAIGFAFLGMLKWRNEVNVWASVTGAKRDSSSGVITLP